MAAKFNSLIFSAFLALVGSTAPADVIAKNGDISVSTGLEYQFLSQEYYDAVIDTSQLDPIEYWHLTTDEINDLIFRTVVDYNYKSQKNFFSLLGDMEYSADRLLGRIEGSYSLGDFNSGLKFFSKYENKSLNGNPDSDCDDAYSYLQTYFKGQQKFSKRLRLQLKTGFETVSFDNKLSENDSLVADDISSFTNYDYSILSTRLGGELTLNEFSKQFYWTITYQHRLVPDSLEAEYDDIRLNVEYSSYDIDGRLAIEAEVEHKDYARSDARYDFRALFLRSRLGKSIGHNIDWGLFLDYDNYQYSNPDVVNRNYQLARIRMQALKQPADWAIGPFGRLEFRAEKKFDFEAEEYEQWELGLAASILDINSLFFDAELSYGRRNYGGDSQVLTSYSFISVSTMINLKIWKHFSFNLTFDGDFESHRLSEDDSNIYLLSTGLSSRF